MYCQPRLRYLRNFVSLVERSPGTFHSVEGDDNFDMPLRGEDQTVEVMKGYVKALAELWSGETIAENPILSVYSLPDTKFYVDVTGRAAGNAQNVMMTQLRLVDGDGNQIHARLAIHLAEIGRMLKRGDNIRLDL